MSETKFRAGDVVRRKSDGQEWLVAAVSLSGRHFYPAGWPCSLEYSEGHELARAASDEKHAEMVRECLKLGAGDPRRILNEPPKPKPEDELATLRAENERLRAELAEANKTIGRLPKTKDGIALFDGLKVWFYSDTNALLRGIVQYWDEFHVLVMSNAGGCYWLKHAGQAEMPAELWSTREAAEAAQAGGAS